MLINIFKTCYCAADSFRYTFKFSVHKLQNYLCYNTHPILTQIDCNDIQPGPMNTKLYMSQLKLVSDEPAKDKLKSLKTAISISLSHTQTQTTLGGR